MGGGGWGLTAGAVSAPSPPTPPPPPAAKFASQGDAHVKTDAQIKFLYYPLNRSGNDPEEISVG